MMYSHSFNSPYIRSKEIIDIIYRNELSSSEKHYIFFRDSVEMKKSRKANLQVAMINQEKTLDQFYFNQRKSRKININ